LIVSFLATFQHPLNFVGKSKSNLVVNLMLNGNQLWSRTIPLENDNFVGLQQNGQFSL
jgi:hypothetical protein